MNSRPTFLLSTIYRKDVHGRNLAQGRRILRGLSSGMTASDWSPPLSGVGLVIECEHVNVDCNGQTTGISASAISSGPAALIPLTQVLRRASPPNTPRSFGSGASELDDTARRARYFVLESLKVQLEGWDWRADDVVSVC